MLMKIDSDGKKIQPILTKPATTSDLKPPFILYKEPIAYDDHHTFSPLHIICHISTYILYSPAHGIYFKCSFW